jgi:hypothetical protein
MNKKTLIAKDLKRYKQLLEYTFYVPEEDKEKDLNGDLLLDDSFLTEQDPPGDDPFMDLTGEEGGEEDTETPTDEEPTTDDTEKPTTGDTETDTTDTEGDVEIEDEFADAETGDEDTVEVDVTDIVDNTEATKTSVEEVGSKMEELLAKLSELEGQVSGMDKVINKIEDLEKEIERRNPTPVERLEMRSLSSFPYSVKLTDFWEDKEGYEAKEDNEEEYILKQSDVDNFDVKQIRASFNDTKEKE